MTARGKREARRPWYQDYTGSRPERPKYTQTITPFQGWDILLSITQGRRAPLRFALAPGCHIPRRWRCISTSAGQNM